MGRRNKATAPDTGSLREDMLAVMRHTNDKRIGLMALVIAFLGGYFQETGTAPYDLRRLVLDDGPPCSTRSSTTRSSAARSIRSD